MPPEDTRQGDPNIARDRVVTLERWGPGSGQEREVPPSPQALVETVRAMAGECSAILAIGVGGEAAEETDWWLGVTQDLGPVLALRIKNGTSAYMVSRMQLGLPWYAAARATDARPSLE